MLESSRAKVDSMIIFDKYNEQGLINPFNANGVAKSHCIYMFLNYYIISILVYQ